MPGYGPMVQMQQFGPQQYQQQLMQEQQQQMMMQQRQAQQEQMMQQAMQQRAEQEQQQQQQQAMQSFGGRYEDAMSSPGIAAALGAGGSMLASADRGESMGGAIRAGLFGGLGGYSGAKQRSKKTKMEEEERRRLLAAITGGFGQVADDGRMPQLSVYQAMMGGLGN